VGIVLEGFGTQEAGQAWELEDSYILANENALRIVYDWNILTMICTSCLRPPKKKLKLKSSDNSSLEIIASKAS
jgi:hypothetical protein